MRYILFTWVVLQLLVSNSALSQSSSGLEVWADYFHYHKLSGKWQFYSDAGFRFESLNSNDAGWWRLHVRPSFVYRSRSLFDLRGGVGLMYNHNNNSNLSSYLEFRPWQGAKIYWPTMGKLRITHYIRMEEHGIFGNGGDDNDFFIKGRYQISTQIPLNNTSVTVGTYFIPLAVEIFANFNKDESTVRRDQFRFSAGLGFRKSEKVDFLFRYIIQKSPTGDNLENVIRLTVKQHFGF